MRDDEVFRGNRLGHDERIVWRGTPGWRGLARDVFHLGVVAGYFGLLLAVNGYEAWAKHLTFDQAVHASIPLVGVVTLSMAVLAGLAYLVGRTTRYTITDRRVILHYGIAIPATLSIPHSQIASVAVTVKNDHSGDLPLTLKSGNHMPYLKLWPLARPWKLSRPEPMLRRVPRAAVVGSLLARAVAAAQSAETARVKASTAVATETPAAVLLTA